MRSSEISNRKNQHKFSIRKSPFYQQKVLKGRPVNNMINSSNHADSMVQGSRSSGGAQSFQSVNDQSISQLGNDYFQQFNLLDINMEKISDHSDTE